MNKFWIIGVLLMVSVPSLRASDIQLHQQNTTAVSFKSTVGQAHTIDIAPSDSIGIVYRKVARAFDWNSLPIIYCRCNRTFVPLALDITHKFLEILKILSYDGQPLGIMPYLYIVHSSQHIQ